MTHKLAAFDRFIVLLLALVFAFFGVWGILAGLNHPLAHKIASYNDQEAWKNAFTADWFKWVLIGGFIACLVLGLWLVLANIRRKKIDQIHSEIASTEVGDVRFNIRDISQAVAQQLEQTPMVRKVSRVTSIDRGQPTMQFTLNCDPEISIFDLRQEIHTAELDIRDAIAEADVDTLYLIHYDKPSEIASA